MSNIEIMYYVFGFLMGCVLNANAWLKTSKELKRLEALMEKQLEEFKTLSKNTNNKTEDYRKSLLSGLESISIDNFKPRK